MKKHDSRCEECGKLFIRTDHRYVCPGCIAQRAALVLPPASCIDQYPPVASRAASSIKVERSDRVDWAHRPPSGEYGKRR
jgi:hypothetical protein